MARKFLCVNLPASLLHFPANFALWTPKHRSYFSMACAIFATGVFSLSSNEIPPGYSDLPRFNQTSVNKYWKGLIYLPINSTHSYFSKIIKYIPAPPVHWKCCRNWKVGNGQRSFISYQNLYGMPYTTWCPGTDIAGLANEMNVWYRGRIWGGGLLMMRNQWWLVKSKKEKVKRKK